jgi:hypothetical protein
MRLGGELLSAQAPTVENPPSEGALSTRSTQPSSSPDDRQRPVAFISALKTAGNGASARAGCATRNLFADHASIAPNADDAPPSKVDHLMVSGHGSLHVDGRQIRANSLLIRSVRTSPTSKSGRLVSRNRGAARDLQRSGAIHRAVLDGLRGLVPREVFCLRSIALGHTRWL